MFATKSAVAKRVFCPQWGEQWEDEQGRQARHH